MLFTEWDMDKALAVSKEEGFEDGIEYGREEGRESKQQELIRKFSKIIEPEQIAETLNKPVEYVLKVLDESLYVCEDAVPYTAEKKE